MTNTPFWTAVARHRFGFTVVILLALSLHTAQSQSQSQLLISLTNQVWRYNETGADLAGTGWEQPGFDDSAWPQGRSVLARDDNFTAMFPYTNTVLHLTYPGNTSQTITYYFRTHFHFSGVPSQTILVSSNFLDDGIVMYLNGVEIFRWMMPDGPINGSTLARAVTPRGESFFGLVLTNGNRALLTGENVMAVEIHQNSSNSTDVAWGTALHAIRAFPPIITQQPAGTNVLQGRSAILTVVADGAPTPNYQWYHNGEPVPVGGIRATYTITNVVVSDEGDYYVEVTNPHGSLTSSIARVVVIPDTSPPTLLAAQTHTCDPQTVMLTFDESLSLEKIDHPSCFQITGADGGSAPVTESFEWNAVTNQLLLRLSAPLERSRHYVLTYDPITGELEDFFGNPLPAGTQKQILFAGMLISRDPGRTLTITWLPCAGQPYEADHLTGPWTPIIPAVAPLTIVPSRATHFYTLRP